MRSSPLHHRVEKPTVLHVRVVTGTGGGPDKTILNSPRFLESQYRTLCAYLHPPRDVGFDQLRQRAKEWHAPLISIADRGPLDWRVIPQAMTVCRREKVAIWHGHDYKSNLLGVLLAKFWRMKLITTVHGWVKHTKRTPLYYAIDRFCLPRYQSVLAVSPDLHEQCLGVGVRADHCQLIENAIDTEEFSRRRTSTQAKCELGYKQNRFLIGAVGRLSEEKGFDLLIRAVARLIEEGAPLELAIVGEGSQMEELRSLAASLNCSEHIHLLGFRSDTKAIYEAMDLFVLSSHREGLPNVLLEAQAMNVPVLSTRIAGVPRLIEHEKSGWLIEPGSIDELTQGIQRLHQNESLRQSLAVEGRKVIESRYSFARRMERVAAIYDQLLQRERS